MRHLMTLLVLALLASGCDGESLDATATASGPSPATSSAPDATPAALSVAEAGPRYLEIVKPYNTALEKFEDAAHAGKPWRDLRPLAGEVAAANAAHAKALREVRWPAEAEAPMAALLTEIDLAQREWERAANAKTADELAQAVRSAVAHSGAKRAGEIRTLLGLPPYSEP